MIILETEDGLFVARRTTGGSINTKYTYKSIPYREWWLPKWSHKGEFGILNLKEIRIPKHLVGKRIRFKVEVLEDGE